MIRTDISQLFEILQDTRSKLSAEDTVKTIINEVKEKGDRALLRFTEKYDGVKLSSIRVPEEQLRRAQKDLGGDLLDAVKTAAKRIEGYHLKQLPRNIEAREPGMKISFRFSPIEKAAIYIPGSQAPLVSSVLMTVIPAKVAGVKKIFAASPPAFNGTIHPSIMGVLYYLGIKDVFQVGGAQAIAAFASGTETFPRADIIAGPGNLYVNTAKTLLFGEVGIDLPAGPSEVVVFSDSSGKKDFIVADIDAQAEHTEGKSIFISTSRKLLESVSRQAKEGFCLFVRNKKEALEVINRIAPEHLQVICRQPETFVRNAVAGAVFIGNYSPASLGDYFAGPSHVLPTERTARFASGLSVYTFLRSYSVIKAEQSFYKRYGGKAEKLASTENLPAHLASLKLRKKRKRGIK